MKKHLTPPTTKPKLTFSKETLRTLADDQLTIVEGGQRPNSCRSHATGECN